MAPLTWRNVDSPDFTRASRIMNDAVGNWAGGFENASQALDVVRQNQKNNRSSELIDDLARVRGEADVDPFLDRLPGTIRARDMNEELQAAILNLRGVGMGYDTERLNQEGIQARTSATRAASGRASAAAAREKAAREALQGAGPEILQAYAASAKGQTNVDQALTLPDFNADTGAISDMAVNIEGGGQHVQDVLAGVGTENPDIDVLQLMKIMQENQSQWNTSQTDQDANWERDFRIRDAEEGRAQTIEARERAERATVDVDIMAAPYTDGAQLLRDINNMDVPAAERDALRAAAQKKIDDGYFESGGDTGLLLSPTLMDQANGMDAAVMQIETAGQSLNLIPEMRVTQMLTDLAASPAETGTGGEGGEGGGSGGSGGGQDMTSQYTNFVKTLGDAGIELGFGGAEGGIGTINKIARETGLSAQQVMQLAPNYLREAYAGRDRVAIDGETLARDLKAAFGTNESRQRLASLQYEQNLRQENIQAMVQERDSIIAQLGILKDRPKTPQVMQTIQGLQRDLQNVVAQARDLNEQTKTAFNEARDEFGVSGVGETETEAVNEDPETVIKSLLDTIDGANRRVQEALPMPVEGLTEEELLARQLQGDVWRYQNRGPGYSPPGYRRP